MFDKVLNMLLTVLRLKTFDTIVKYIQKQPSRDVVRKRCSENVQQIYWRTPMPKCDFNKVAKQLLKLHFGMGALT